MDEILSKQITKNKYISSDIISIVIIIIFLLFWVWIIYKINSSSNTDRLLIECVPGQCGTNIHNGEKRCPKFSSDTVLIDASYEVCNSRYTCDNNRTPFAVLSDGSTNNLGVCEPNTICRCLTTGRCGNHVSTLFQSMVPNPSGGITFQQIPSVADIGTENVTFSERNTNFCGVRTNRLNRLSPGSCTFSDLDYNNGGIRPYIVTDCINSNPCIKGSMAFNTNTPDRFEKIGITDSDIKNIPVACINSDIVCGNPRERLQCENNVCPENSLPYWDRRWGFIRCAKVLI